MTKLSISALQTFGACNLNTDDNGAVKTVTFGGSVRVRVSSQAWKASIRRAFRESGNADIFATRTKYSPEMIINRAIELDPSLDHEAVEKELVQALKRLKPAKAQKRAEAKTAAAKVKADAAAAAAAEAGGNPVEEAPDESLGASTAALFTVSEAQVNAAADLVVEAVRSGTSADAKKMVLALGTDSNISGEQALFGRFFADDTSLSIDAACQVAHAMGITEMTPGFDYFVGRDDLLDSGALDSGDKGKGGGHLGVKEFSSGTLYRYATVDFDQLVKTLGDSNKALDTVAAFIDGFLRTVPIGAKNSYGTSTLPSTVVVEVGDSTVNYAPAFEASSRTSEDGTRRLFEYIGKVNAAFDITPSLARVLTLEGATAPEGYNVATSISDIIADVRDELDKDA